MKHLLQHKCKNSSRHGKKKKLQKIRILYKKWQKNEIWQKIIRPLGKWLSAKLSIPSQYFSQYSLSVFQSVPFKNPSQDFNGKYSPLCLWTMFQFSEHAYCLKFWEILWQFRVIHNKPFSQYVINYNRREKGPHGGWRHWTHYSKTSLSEKQKKHALLSKPTPETNLLFLSEKSWEQKTGTLPHLALDIANFLGNFILFRHQSMCTINLFFRIQFNGIIFLIKLNLYPFLWHQYALYFSPFSLFNFLQ